jgi:hypothetical protein
LAQLIQVSISIGSHCIHQAFIKIAAKFPLVVPQPVKTVLLSNCYGWSAIVFDVNGVGVILKSTTNSGGLPL